MRRLLFQRSLLLFLLLPFLGRAQDLTGIWRGYFVTEMGEQYKLEFQVAQNRTKAVTGVSYSYLDTRFYGKATMTGNYALSNSAFTIQELRTVEVRNLGGGSTCLMNYKFTYARSGKEEFLEGTYIGKTEDRSNPKNNGKWGDCGGGTVYLRRVVTSDFPLETFLKNKPAPKKDTVVLAGVAPTPARKPATKPATAKPAPQPATPALARRTPERTPVVTERKITDTPQRKAAPIIAETPVEKPRIVTPAVIRARQNELTQTLTVTSEEIVVRLYDNGEIDDDTISVYLDGQLVLANKRLSATPIIYTIRLNEDVPEHTLVMVAENLGRIPPNTSLMVVQDGDRRHQVSITSTNQKNAMVRFRYQKP